MAGKFSIMLEHNAINLLLQQRPELDTPILLKPPLSATTILALPGSGWRYLASRALNKDWLPKPEISPNFIRQCSYGNCENCVRAPRESSRSYVTRDEGVSSVIEGMRNMELNIAELISELESELDGAMWDLKTREREMKHEKEITSHDEEIKKPIQVPVAVVKPETRSKLPKHHSNTELRHHSNTVSHHDSDITELKHPVTNSSHYSTSAAEFLKESSRHHHDDQTLPPPRLSPTNPFYENFPEPTTESRTPGSPTESRTPETVSESRTPAPQSPNHKNTTYSSSSEPTHKNTTYCSSEPIMLTSERTISHSTSSHRPSSGPVTSSSGKRRKTTGSSSSSNVQLHQIPRTNLFIYNGSVISLQSLLNKLNSDGCHGNIPARPMTSLQQKHNALPSNNRLLDLVSRGTVDSTAVNEMTLGKCYTAKLLGFSCVFTVNFVSFPGSYKELIDLKANPLPGYSNGSLEPPHQFAAGFAMKKSVISGWAWYLRFQPETKKIRTPRIGVEKKPRALKT
eukprot:sb/3463934/